MMVQMQRVGLPRGMTTQTRSCFQGSTKRLPRSTQMDFWWAFVSLEVDLYLDAQLTSTSMPHSIRRQQKEGRKEKKRIGKV